MVFSRAQEEVISKDLYIYLYSFINVFLFPSFLNYVLWKV